MKSISVKMGNSFDTAGPAGKVEKSMVVDDNPTGKGVIILTAKGLGRATRDPRTGNWTCTNFLPCPSYSRAALRMFGVDWDEVKHLAVSNAA